MEREGGTERTHRPDRELFSHNGAGVRARSGGPGCEMCGREKQEAAVFQSPGAWRVNERPLPVRRLQAGRSNWLTCRRKFLSRARVGAGD